MKILLISDLHANPVSVEGLLRRERNWDTLVCLGDYLDQGHQPDDLVSLMRSHSHLGVPGNHDFHVIHTAQRYPELRDGRDRKQVEFIANEEWHKLSVASLSDANWHWFADFCAGPRFRNLEMDGWYYLFTHTFCAEWVNSKDPNLVRPEYHVPEGKGDMVEFIEKVTGAFDPAKRYRVCTGHRHYRWHLRLSDNLEYINPGSTAYMRKGDMMAGAEYIVIEDGKISLRCHDYDWRAFYRPGNFGPYDGCYPLPRI